MPAPFRAHTTKGDKTHQFIGRETQLRAAVPQPSLRANPADTKPSTGTDKLQSTGTSSCSFSLSQIWIPLIKPLLVVTLKNSF